MNQRAKGKLHEKAVADWLREEGWRVERGFKKVAFINGKVMAIDKDLFEAFDIIALRWPHPPRFIQVTSANSSEGGQVALRKRKAFEAWPHAEVWEHARSGSYWIHRADGSCRIIDTKAGS